MNYVLAFLFGGVVCAVGQIVLDRTRIKQADLMVILVVIGSFVSALGFYDPLVKTFGAGASVLVANFGHIMTQGVIKGFAENGILGALEGGLISAAPVLGVAILFGFIIGLLFRPKG